MIDGIMLMLRTCNALLRVFCTEKPTTRIKVTDLAAYVDRMTETDGFVSEFKVPQDVFHIVR